MTVLLVAAPLSARSGVHRSTVELVRTARRAGCDWRAVIGVRPGAGGEPAVGPGITESVVTARGRAVLAAVTDLVRDHLHDVDTVITMVPQSDVALSRMRGRPRHVAWVRGLPWPGPGEQGRFRSAAIRGLVRRALRRADTVWATSPMLAQQIASVTPAQVVAAGVPLLPRSSDGATAGPLVWAGRLSVEKGPEVLLEIARRTGHPTIVHGEGPMAAALTASSPSSVQWRPWADPSTIWHGPGIALCTSHRDAFGRSPVEAASAGMPVVLSDQTGVGPFLYTDPELAERFVLPLHDLGRWTAAVHDLVGDETLRRRVSDHVAANAQRLSIEASFLAARARLDEDGPVPARRSPGPAPLSPDLENER